MFKYIRHFISDHFDVYILTDMKSIDSSVSVKIKVIAHTKFLWWNIDKILIDYTFGRSDVKKIEKIKTKSTRLRTHKTM